MSAAAAAAAAAAVAAAATAAGWPLEIAACCCSLPRTSGGSTPFPLGAYSAGLRGPFPRRGRGPLQGAPGQEEYLGAPMWGPQ